MFKNIEKAYWISFSFLPNDHKEWPRLSSLTNHNINIEAARAMMRGDSDSLRQVVLIIHCCTLMTNVDDINTADRLIVVTGDVQT